MVGISIFLEVGNSVFRPLSFFTSHPLGISIFRPLRNSIYHFQAASERGLLPVQLCRGLRLTPSPWVLSHELKNLCGSKTSFRLSMK